MLKKQVSGLTAQKLRLLLIVSIALLLAAAGVGFWFAHKQLVSFAEEVRKVTATATASTDELSTLQSLKRLLAEDADTVERTKNIVAESQDYTYQDQIIKDINTYANRAGVTILSYEFGTRTQTGGQASSGASPLGGAKPVAGLKTVGVSVSIKSPVKYTNIMNFIHYIEQNLTKMQLAGISLTKDQQSDNITANSFNIEVYTRS